MSIQVEQVPINSVHGRAIMAIRMQVFVEEQNVPVEYEVDSYDAAATHLAAVDGGAVLGTCRLLKNGVSLKIGRVAVLKEHRRRGIGRALMHYAIQFARAHNCTACELTAQLPVIPFYEKLGFTAHGAVFLEVNMPHRAMTLTLT